MANLRTHKSFSDIEQDIRLYYENGTIDAELTALKVAGRALAVAQLLVEPVNRLETERAKAIVDSLIVNRQMELAR